MCHSYEYILPQRKFCYWETLLLYYILTHSLSLQMMWIEACLTANWLALPLTKSSTHSMKYISTFNLWFIMYYHRLDDEILNQVSFDMFLSTQHSDMYSTLLTRVCTFQEAKNQIPFSNIKFRTIFKVYLVYVMADAWLNFKSSRYTLDATFNPSKYLVL